MITPAMLADLHLFPQLALAGQPPWLRADAAAAVAVWTAQIRTALDLDDDAAAEATYATLLRWCTTWREFDYRHLPPPLAWRPGESPRDHWLREFGCVPAPPP